MNGSLRRIAAAALALPLVALAGCATPATQPAATSQPTPSGTPMTTTPPMPSEPTAPPSQQDTDALAQLAEVAPKTSTIDPTLADWTECWLPSAHLIPADQVGNATTWKVICRIHWHQEKDGTPRYQDTNCIGDFAQQPMLDHCYRWVHYDLEPEFEDHPAVRASA